MVGPPIFEDTEVVAKKLGTTLTFHRYLPATHDASLQAIEACTTDHIDVLPLFPQFSYATTGSIARFFEQRLSLQTQQKLRWVRSYYQHPIYIDYFAEHIRNFLKKENIAEEDTLLFFSPHGVPTEFVCTGDPYKKECEASYNAIRAQLPNAQSLLAYQSKFGPAEWLRPYTDETCEKIREHIKGEPTVVFIPLSFTSDHVETLVEVEDQYLPVVQKAGLHAVRCPAFNTDDAWIDVLQNILFDSPRISNRMLIRDLQAKCPGTCKGCLCPYVQPLVSSGVDVKEQTADSPDFALSTR